jgi:hypothetical protein
VALDEIIDRVIADSRRQAEPVVHVR